MFEAKPQLKYVEGLSDVPGGYLISQWEITDVEKTTTVFSKYISHLETTDYVLHMRNQMYFLWVRIDLLDVNLIIKSEGNELKLKSNKPVSRGT